MKKIILEILIIFLLVGSVYAANPVDIFKAPAGMQPAGNTGYADGQGHNIIIVDYNNYDTWFKNDSDKYLVEKFNDTVYTGVTDENDVYLLEIVEKDNAKYIIQSWSPKGVSETQIIQKNLEEFNKINQLTPLPIEG